MRFGKRHADFAFFCGAAFFLWHNPRHTKEAFEMRGTALAAGLVLCGSVALAAQAGSKAATEKMLIANEAKINEAVAKRDVKAFNDLVASDAVSADGNGFMKVADFLKTIDQLKIASFHVMDEKVTWVNDKTAVVTYSWMGNGTYMNQPVPAMDYSSTVWTERNGKWVAVFHQESAAAPAAPAKKK
jgi:hypothetical protein